MNESFNIYRFVAICGLIMSFLINFTLTFCIIISVLLVIMLLHKGENIFYRLSNTEKMFSEYEQMFVILSVFATFTLFTAVLYNLFTN